MSIQIDKKIQKALIAVRKAITDNPVGIVESGGEFIKFGRDPIVSPGGDINHDDLTLLRKYIKGDKTMPMEDFEEILKILVDMIVRETIGKGPAIKALNTFDNIISDLYGDIDDDEMLYTAVRIAEDLNLTIIEALAGTQRALDEDSEYDYDDIRQFTFEQFDINESPSVPSSEVPKTGGTGSNVDPLNLETDEMKTDQQILDQIREIDEQNEYIKKQILILNQNVVKKKELEYITQEQDIDRYNRRILEAQKYKYDEADRSQELSRIANEEQYLTRQTYANYYWGIPSMSDPHIKYPEDFFTG